MGGVWEQQIKSAKNILSSPLKAHGTGSNDEALSTFMTEVEAVLNSRLLMTELLNDGNSHNPLCHSDILTLKVKVVMLPPPSW